MTEPRSPALSQPPQPVLPPPDMHETHGPIMRWLFSRFFAKVIFATHEQRIIREAAQKGIVIYAMRTPSFVAYLYFNFAYVLYNLPLARFVSGLRTAFFMPVRQVGEYRRTRIKGFSGHPFEEETRLGFLTRMGESSLIFLRHTQSWFRDRAGYRADYIKTLLQLQRKMNKPILLVPQSLIYLRRQINAKPRFIDLLFGSAEAPGLVRDLLLFLRHHRQARVAIGEPVDLQQFLAQYPGAPDDVLVKKLRWLLLFYLKRQQEVAVGPPRKDPGRIVDLVLRDSQLRASLETYAQNSGTPASTVAQEAMLALQEIAANQNMRILEFFNWLGDRLWSLVKLRVHLDPTSMERLRQLAHTSTLVLCPNHRSHADYIILSQACLANNLMPPHIAAGANLRFWPMGPLFRGCGAFFLRRKFARDSVYSHVFRTYVKRMIADGHTQEFFIEGGRSRGGKTLPPKMGLLTMYLEAYLATRRRDLLFIPIGIAYDHVMEAQSYARELTGAPKQKESFAAMIRSAGVVRHEVGNTYIRVGDPIAASAALPPPGGEGPDNPRNPEMRSAIDRLGHRIASTINALQPVTPPRLLAAALLQFPGKARDYLAIRDSAMALHAYLGSVPGHFFAPPLKDPEGALRLALLRFARSGLVRLSGPPGAEIVAIPPEHRILLDFHKNGILHFFAALGMVALARLWQPPDRLDAARLRDDTAYLWRLLHNEFIYRTDETAPEIAAAAVARAQARGWFIPEGSALLPNPAAGSEIARFAELLRATIEGYHFAATHLKEIGQSPSPLDTRALEAALLRDGRAAVRAGHIERPEAINKELLANACASFRDLGLVTEETLAESSSGERPPPRLRLSPEYVNITLPGGLLARLETLRR